MRDLGTRFKKYVEVNGFNLDSHWYISKTRMPKDLRDYCEAEELLTRAGTGFMGMPFYVVDSSVEILS